MKQTNFMLKIFSDSTPEDFKAKVSEKIEEAKANGSSELKEGDQNLKFTEVNGDVAVTDKNHGDEVTIAHENEDGKQELHSATEPDVFVPKPKGETQEPEIPGSTEPDVKVSIDEAIIDGDKAGTGKSFSITISGFKSREEATQYYSELYNEGEVYCFSEAECEQAEAEGKKLGELAERVEGTKDPKLAEELKTRAESLKAYSVLGLQSGVDLSDLHEAACIYSEYADDALDQAYSEMDVNEFFSDMTEDEIDAYFSELDEVTANTLYSALTDDEETYTFSEVQEAADRVYADLEGEMPINAAFSNEDELDAYLAQFSDEEQDMIFSMFEDDENVTFSDVEDAIEFNNMPFTEVFSDMTDDEVDAYFSELTDNEVDAIYSAVEEDPDVTFSEVNEILDTLNTPMTEFFSAEDEEGVVAAYSEFEDNFGTEYADLAFSMAIDEDETYTYSDFLDQIEADMTFSEEDVDQMAKNTEEVGKACKDAQESNDPELAKKVKVLADAIKEDAELAAEQGHDTDEVKSKCESFSQIAEDILIANKINPRTVDFSEVKVFSESTFDQIDTDHDGKITKDEWVAAGKSEDDFTKIDTNNDGVISKEEFEATSKPAEPAKPAVEPKADPKPAEPKDEPTKSDDKKFSIPGHLFGESVTKTFSKEAEKLENKTFSSSAQNSKPICKFLDSKFN